MQKQHGLLIVLTGPSGVGKGTLKRRVLQEIPGLRESVSVTTRPQRPGEVDGTDYHFVSSEQFDALIAKDALLEWAEYAGNCYGTPKQPVLEALDRGESMILEIEVQGALHIRKWLPEAMLIFIEPPSLSELEHRLRGRQTNDETDIQRRMTVAQWELSQKTAFDHILVNKDVAQCTQDLLALIRPRLPRPEQAFNASS